MAIFVPMRHCSTFAKLPHDATIPSAAGFRRRHSAPPHNIGSRGIAAIARPTRTAKIAMIASLMMPPGNSGNRGTGRGAGDSVPRLLSLRRGTAFLTPLRGNACTSGRLASGKARGHDCLHLCGQGLRCGRSRFAVLAAGCGCSCDHLPLHSRGCERGTLDVSGVFHLFLLSSIISFSFIFVSNPSRLCWRPPKPPWGLRCVHDPATALRRSCGHPARPPLDARNAIDLPAASSNYL